MQEHKTKSSAVLALDAVSAGPSALKPFAMRESLELNVMEHDTNISTTVSLVDTGVLPSESASSSSESEESSESDSEDGEYDEDEDNKPVSLPQDGNPTQLLNYSTEISDFYDKLHLMRCELYFVDIKGESEGKTRSHIRANHFPPSD